MAGVGIATAKLLLFGEHASVYGYPAVGIGMPWKMAVSLSRAAIPRIQAAGIEEKHEKKLASLLQKIPGLFPEAAQLGPFEIRIASESQIGIGFGSSGALSVALTRSLYALLGQQASPHKIWECAHEFEKAFHHTPSGVDTGLSTFGGLCAFEGRSMGLPKARPIAGKTLHLVVGALPRELDTGTLVSQLRQRKSEVQPLLRELGDIAYQAIQILAAEINLFELGRLAIEAQSLLKALRLSTPSLDALVHVGQSLGAPGGKLSGAGGGGAYYLFAESPSHAKTLALELQTFASKNQIDHKLPPTALIPHSPQNVTF